MHSQGLRKLNVISKEEIDKFPVHAVPQKLQHILGVDIRQRGALGVQADLSMRGANFEQVLVCLNGVRINDPQTGHHNMDLPLTLADIERIEILPGHGLGLYGSAAFGGTINIVTKVPKETALEIETSGGDYSLSSQTLSLTQSLGTFNNRLSFARKESSAYRPETDFEITSLTFDSQKEFEFGSLEYLFGYTDKDFGADSFYSNLYPYEEEHTDTRFFNLKAHLKNKMAELRADFYYRRHADKFILNRHDPSWYVNYHTSYTYGADLQASKEFAFGSLSAGAEVTEEKITSTRLGGHSRNNQALYGQFQSPFKEPFIYNLGLRLDHYQKWGWEASPSISLGYKIVPQLSFKSSLGRCFRVPSFTDLYYWSPANVGNQNLTPEKAWSAETGLNFSRDAFSAEVTYFHRWAEDLIGWVRASSSDVWEAQNIAEVDTQGVEFELTLKPEKKWGIFSGISPGYVYQYSESESTSLNTKYALEFLKHHAHIDLSLAWPWGLAQNLSLSYKQRIDQRRYFLLDTRISKKIEAQGFVWELFLDITNHLNTSYSEQGEVTMPGRWLIGGLRLKI